jgi:uncharacterized protein HemX
MSTVHIGGQPNKPAVTKPKSQTMGLIVAIVLLVIAAGLVVSRTIRTRAEESKAMVAASPEKRIQEIRDNPHMPPQAKAFAEAQIRAHQQETTTRTANQPSR